MAAHGVSPHRLVLGKMLPAAAHMRRAAAADLFLDTVAYNGHTSAADALWAVRDWEKGCSRGVLEGRKGVI
jgi:protein O-GlcNAc transferase